VKGGADETGGIGIPEEVPGSGARAPGQAVCEAGAESDTGGAREMLAHPDNRPPSSRHNRARLRLIRPTAASMLSLSWISLAGNRFALISFIDTAHPTP
jgi:hypothetical protein